MNWKGATAVLFILAALACQVQSAPNGTPLPAAFFGATINGGYGNKFPLAGGMTLGALGKVPGTSIKYIEPIQDCGADPASACYHWGAVDSWIGYAQAHGMKVIYDLDSMPGWMCALHNIDGNCAGLPSSTASITHFATALATRYRGKVSYYETYNEVSNRYEWADSCANLVYFHNLVRNAIKAADPGAKVGAPNVAIQGYQPACQAPVNVYSGGSMLDVAVVENNFLSTQDRTGHYPAVDTLGVHLYGVKAYPECAQGCYTLPSYGCDPSNQLDCASTKLLNVYAAFRALMASSGLGSQPLLVTEGGFGSDKQASGNCSNYSTACLTAAEQTAYIGRWLVLLASTYADGAGVLANWYGYDVSWGTLNGSYGMNPENAAAYGEIESWLSGASFDVPCSASGTLIACSFTTTKPNLVVFNNASGQTISYAAPLWASQMTPLLGRPAAIQPGAMISVDENPILLQP